MERRHRRELARSAPYLSLRSRLRVLCLPVLRRFPVGGIQLAVGPGHVSFDPRTIEPDWQAFLGIFLPRHSAYSADYRDTHVIDVGAHKGYFGAWALLSGAHEVVSFEPERRNFAHLEVAARSFRRAGFRWRVERAAVEAQATTASLHVSKASWSHSLAPLPSEGASAGVRSEEVEVHAFADIVPRRSPRRRLLVKIDAEGSECPIVLETPPTAWSQIDEAFIESHSFATCEARDLERHLHELGFQVTQVADVLRAVADRSSEP